MPVWLPLLLQLISSAPAIVRAIEISKLPPLTPEYMAQLQAAMDAAVKRLDDEIEAQTKTQ